MLLKSMAVLFLLPRPWRFLSISISLKLCAMRVERGVSSNVCELVRVLVLAFLLLLVLFPSVSGVLGGVRLGDRLGIAGLVEVCVGGLGYDREDEDEDEEERKMLLERQRVMNLELEAGVVTAVRGLEGRIIFEAFAEIFGDVSVEERVLTLSLLGEARIARDDLAFLFIRSVLAD